ncbi:MAG TPA: 4-hydroxy-3-methylbut-2-enyl diphosphate reductase [Armatimonadota bacterium]|nr:4-hydroxy-3-methylbut-2-enyl diphosphate reductase [Armatimonadota bacterium]
MRVLRADFAGFCPGVERALALVEAALAQGHPLCSLGPLIHNDQVVRRLADEGLRCADVLDDVRPGETLVVRTHGVPASVTRQAAARGVRVIDATCRFVRRAHQRAHDLAEAGYQVCIVGDRDHPEVLGITGSVSAECLVLETPEQAEACAPGPRVGVVAQTTQTASNYRDIVGVLATKCRELVAHNTLCNATADRQSAALRLAQSADVMLVVGGRHSANTRRLVEICAATGTPTYHVEGPDEAKSEWFVGARAIGVTAGASTPNEHIAAVEQRVAELTGAMVGPPRPASARTGGGDDDEGAAGCTPSGA